VLEIMTSKKRPPGRTPVAAASKEIATLRVELVHIEPLIWRRVQVPWNILLPELHRVLQCVMGWQDSHLHAFEVESAEYGIPDEAEEHGMKDERRVRLDQALGKSVREFSYLYDFGDHWEHRLVVEEIAGAKPDWRYPLCLAGERACPPEDVGGPPGYGNFLEAIRQPDHPEHEEFLRWVGGVFDPEGFDLNSINRALRDRR
jgi:hypothetical protein